MAVFRFRVDLEYLDLTFHKDLTKAKIKERSELSLLHDLDNLLILVFFFSSRRRHTRCLSDWSSDVCSSDLEPACLSMRQSIGIKPVPPNRVLSNVSEILDCKRMTTKETNVSNT